MKISNRKAATLGIILLVCAVAFLVIPGGSSPDGGGMTDRGTTAKPLAARHSHEATGGTGAAGEEPGNDGAVPRTRSKERPVETDLDRMRRQRHRLADQMQIFERAGLGERHPSRVKVAEDLKKIDEDLSAKGGAVHAEP